MARSNVEATRKLRLIGAHGFARAINDRASESERKNGEGTSELVDDGTTKPFIFCGAVGCVTAAEESTVAMEVEGKQTATRRSNLQKRNNVFLARSLANGSTVINRP